MRRRDPALLYSRLAVLAGLWVGLMSWSSHGEAAEQRCNDLGANCICSEPFQTATYNAANADTNARSWNPADSTTKECAMNGTPGAAFFFSGSTIGPGLLFPTTAAQDPAIFSALPPGRTNTYVLREADGVSAAFAPGTMFPAGAPLARWAIRIYLYISPNTVFTEENGQCNNIGKILQFMYDSGPVISNHNAQGGWHTYGYSGAFNGVPSGWSMAGASNPATFPFDCCVTGPGSDAASYRGTSFYKGKWWRLEGIIENIGGTPTVLKAYMQDVTTQPNPPEIKIIDTAIATAQVVGNQWGANEVATATRGNMAGNPAAPAFFDLYRNTSSDGSGPGQPLLCTGFYAVTHMMAAAWSTNAGQRIGPASEIESGALGVVPSAPTAPKLQ